ncbi:hypothetical protein BAQ53_24445 [Bacillus sp. B25(2016b)]|uniref:hypothetical protein n=1 Tax=Bacillus sp. B25(2016b) TaxID=1868655 RepID=UPI000803D5A4|nr:hypothetical protein [Bacillus sp. B25(2016b)]ANP83879.1 hypothetical protein BAQ53_24445 [Bacillus sp. B25(2016b)]
MLTKEEKTEQLLLLANKTRLVSDLSHIALNLMDDENYTREEAAKALIEIVDNEISCMPTIS